MGEVQEQWYNILEELLQCCVCLEVPQCFVVLCTFGHHICIFCRNKLQECPMCKQQFLETRNVLAEDLVYRLEDMKLCIQKKTVDTSTQTDFVEKTKSCSATQTIDLIEKNKRKQNVHFYFCPIGSCLFKSSYIGLTEHLRQHHKDTFYEADCIDEVFSEKCIIDTSVPQYYDFAFLINGMGLFFFNITIHFSGELRASVHYVQNLKTSMPYHYDLTVANKGRLFKRHGKIIPCGVQKELDSSYSLFIHKTRMLKMIKASNDKTVECTITIRNCSCK